jgi:hypothetical protein
MQQAFGMRNSNKIEMELSVVVYAFHRFKFVPCSATDTTEMMPWPQKTKAARIPSGVLRTSWRQRLLQRPTSVPSLGLRLCDVMCSGFFRPFAHKRFNRIAVASAMLCAGVVQAAKKTTVR